MEVVERAARHVMSARRDLIGVVGAAMDATQTTLTLTVAIAGLAAGAELEVGFETMYVVAYTVGATTVTVARGYNATRQMNHRVGDFVRVNPTIPRSFLLAKCNAVLHALSAPTAGLYRLEHTDIATSSGRFGYDLNPVDEFMSVVAVRWRSDNIGSWQTVRGYSVMTDADLTDFPSGVAIKFDDPPGSYRSRVWYRAGFGELSADPVENVEAATGLPATAVDILEIGAAILAVEGREIARTDTARQADTARAQDIPTGAANQATARLAARYAARVADEAQRLESRVAQLQ